MSMTPAAAVLAAILFIPAAPASAVPASTSPCVTSAVMGNCGYYSDPDITQSDGSNTVVQADGWNCQNAPQPGCGPTTLTAWSASHWSETTDMPNRSGSVQEYPNTAQGWNNTDGPFILGQMTLLRFHFSVSEPANLGNLDNEWATDMYVNDPSGTAQEVMFWVDNQGQTPAGHVIGTFTDHGQPVTVWDTDDPEGSGLVSFVLDTNETSGTIHMLPAVKYLIASGLDSAQATLGGISFGTEICQTDGAQAFGVNDYWVHAAGPGTNG